MVTLSLIKEARIYSGEKTASSISGAGKTGYAHALKKNDMGEKKKKTEVGALSDIVYKNYLKMD